MKRYTICLRRVIVKKMAIVVLIIAISMFPMNANAGGSGGKDVSPSHDAASTAVWAVLMAALIGGLIYTVSHGKKEIETQSSINSSEVDITSEDLVSSSDFKKLVTPKGELIVHNW